MNLTAHCPLAATLATHLRAARDELTARWLERISARVALEPNRVFPTEQLLDHVPLLVDGIAAYLENPATMIVADMLVIDKARELGALRHAQGFDQFEILKEFEILGGILLTFIGGVAEQSNEPCGRAELLGCAQRVFHAVSLIQEATTTQFLQLMTQRLAEREERLKAFNLTLTHEFRNRIGATLGAAQILGMGGIADDKREQLSAVIVRNAKGMQVVLDNLLELSRVGSDSRQQRHVRLPQAAAEAARQLRETAHSHKVTVRLLPTMPDVEVNAAAVELCLTNLISNAIKYSDPAEPDRWIEVRGKVEETTGDGIRQVIVEVADNGLGVPLKERQRLFERFFRAEDAAASGVEGTGLGLSIVRETIHSLGGTVWAEFPENGSVFAFSLPCRREGEPSPLPQSSPH
ncbi:MAG: ATP-binding protein [Gemmatimonadaceae bacterium]